MDFVRQMGILAIGTRLRRLGERMQMDVSRAFADERLEIPPACGPLFALVCRKGSISIGEAAAMLGLTHPAVSQFSRDLMRKGLIASKGDPKDDRRRLLGPTPAGRLMAKRLEPHHREVRAVLNELVREAGADLPGCLDRMEDALAERSLLRRIRERANARRAADVEIVEFDPKIGGAFKTLNMEWISKHFEAEALDRQVLSDPRKHIIRPGGAVLFARAQGEIIGTCALQKVEDGVFELCKMAVRPSAQGCGVGEKLARAVIDRARKLGARKVILESHHSLATAVRLYRRLGFVDVKPSHRKFARTDVFMELALRSAKAARRKAGFGKPAR